LDADDQLIKADISPREQLYTAIEEQLDRLRIGVQVLVARSGVAEAVMQSMTWQTKFWL